MKADQTESGRSYWLTKHARDQLSRRQIKKREVEEVIDNHHLILPDKEKKENQRFIGITANGKELKLVVEKDSNPLKVITVIETS